MSAAIFYLVSKASNCKIDYVDSVARFEASPTTGLLPAMDGENYEVICQTNADRLFAAKTVTITRAKGEYLRDPFHALLSRARQPIVLSCLGLGMIPDFTRWARMIRGMKVRGTMTAMTATVSSGYTISDLTA